MGYSNILIAVDGSDCSVNAVKKGIELANQLSANVILLYVVDMTTIVANTSVGAVIDDELEGVYKGEASKTLETVSQKYPYEKTTRIIEEGISQEAINKVAEERKADLIIMGTHGRTGLDHLFMGSVAEHVIRYSKIPVMVVTSLVK